jgi:DNA segregation ATPase FtsK/SpoIIIE-like protein
MTMSASNEPSKPGRAVPWPEPYPTPEIGVVRYGVADDGSPQSWHLDRQPHCLVAGAVGAGRTAAISAITTAALQLPEGAEVVGADPKSSMIPGEFPDVRRLATESGECVDLLFDVANEMWRRYELVCSDPAALASLSRLFVVLSEYDVLRLRLNRLWRQTKSEDAEGATHPAIETVRELVALGRSARIHLVVGVGRADAELIDGGARDNFRHRISLGPLPAWAARVMWGGAGPTAVAAAGADLMRVRGRALATDADGLPRPVQVFGAPTAGVPGADEGGA